MNGTTLYAEVRGSGPDALSTATAAGDDLKHRLRDLNPAVETARRVLAAPRA